MSIGGDRKNPMTSEAGGEEWPVVVKHDVSRGDGKTDTVAGIDCRRTIKATLQPDEVNRLR